MSYNRTARSPPLNSTSRAGTRNVVSGPSGDRRALRSSYTLRELGNAVAKSIMRIPRSAGLVSSARASLTRLASPINVIWAEIGEDRRAPYAGLNRIRFQGFVSIPTRRVGERSVPDTPGGHRDYTDGLLRVPVCAVMHCMRYALLLSFLVVAPVAATAQTAPAPAPPKTGAPAPAPAPAQPARPRAAAPAQSTRSGIAITVNDPNGSTIENVHVEVTGPMSKSGETNPAGQVNFPGLPAGTYRLRFTGDAVVAFEREATLRGGQVTPVQVTLTRAEPKKEVAAPPPAVVKPAVVGPVGSPQWGSLTDLAKKAQQSKPPRREVLLACSGNSRSTLLVLTEDQPQRVYDDAEATYYVLDGQGMVTIGDRPGEVTTGSFVSVPRGMPYTMTRRSNKPLIVLWVLSGARCEEAR